jgi:elongation factor G
LIKLTLVKIYETQNIRNVALVGPTTSGKTSLLEAFLFNVGAIGRMGKVTEGNTVSDYYAEEIKRKSSIHATLAAVEYNDFKINFIDSPGYIDFIGEAISSMRVADSAVFSFCGVAGAGVGAEEFWKQAEEFKLPAIIVINRLDKERSDFDQALESLRSALGKSVVPLHVPIGKEAGFKGIINLANSKAYEFENGKPKEVPVPGDIDTSPYKEMLIEALADVDDTLLSDYLEGKELTVEEITTALKKGIADRKVFPVLCCSSMNNVGPSLVLEMIKEYATPPTIRIQGKDKAGGELKLTGKKDEQMSAYVFKTVTEPHVGELSFIRVYSGAINHSTAIYNSTRSHAERAGQLIIPQGKKRSEVMTLNAGDIGVLPKLKTSHSGDTLCQDSKIVIFPAPTYPEPVYSLAVHPKSKEDQEKIGIAFNSFSKEDPTFKVKYDPEIKETVISGMGDVHLEMILERFKKQFGVEVDLTPPRIPYKETIKKKSQAQGKYKKQTGGRGQYGDTSIEIEPLPKGKGFEFVNRIVGGAIPKNYIPAVEKGIKGAMAEGVVAGYQVVDLKATLFDGSYHEVDSSDMAFKIAGSMGFKKAVEGAKPTILEPIMEIEVNAPEEYVGGIAGDLNKRRGRILNIEEKKIVAEVPLVEIAKYAVDIRSITHGRGHFKTKFARYEEAPAKTQEELTAIYKKKREAGSK